VNTSYLSKKNYLIITILSIFSFIAVSQVFAGTAKTIAVIPFKINSDKDITYIQSGVSAMFHSRLSWKDNIQVMEKNRMQSAIADLPGRSESAFLTEFAQKTRTDYLLTGSITEFADAYSFDTKVFDMEKMTYLTFYDQAATRNEIIKKFNIIAAKINKKIFNRTTVAYEKYEKDKTIDAENLRRMNPERLMPVGVDQDDEKDEPWWKVWKYLPLL